MVVSNSSFYYISSPNTLRQHSIVQTRGFSRMRPWATVVGRPSADHVLQEASSGLAPLGSRLTTDLLYQKFFAFLFPCRFVCLFSLSADVYLIKIFTASHNTVIEYKIAILWLVATFVGPA